MTAPSATINFDSPTRVTPEQIAQFRRDGHIMIKGVFTPEEIAAVEPLISAAVERQKAHLAQYQAPIEARGFYQQAFVQIMNLWESDPATKAWIFNKRLARLATELMGTRGVRMFHDQALYKEAKGGATPWHTDQAYWPLASELSITAWVPLVPVSLDMGPLSFASGSHRLVKHRDSHITLEAAQAITETVRLNQLPTVTEPFALGDVTFHYGFTYHFANRNSTDCLRKVMTMIYMDSEMRLGEASERTKGDAEWLCSGIKPGELIDTAKTPILYQR
ncbi:MAG: phytanoyl-CoA dioxygenase family protein [Planctomycetota bacterium]